MLPDITAMQINAPIVQVVKDPNFVYEQEAGFDDEKEKVLLVYERKMHYRKAAYLK